MDRANSIRLGKIEKDDDRRIADAGVVAGKGQAARLAIHAEDGDVVGALIAGVEESTGWIEIEAAGIIPARPFLTDVGQGTGLADGEDRDAVVQTIAGVEKPAVGRDHNFRAEIAAGEPGRQGGDGLPGGKTTLHRVIVE